MDQAVLVLHKKNAAYSLACSILAIMLGRGLNEVSGELAQLNDLTEHLEDRYKRRIQNS